MVPVYPREIFDPQNDMSRVQFPVVLGWALTPWKAQGLTLKRAIVEIGKAVSETGVLFVALSRVRHPDDLMLDDYFPSLFSILELARHENVKKRHRLGENGSL